MYSLGMPRMRPAIKRPPLITSSMAYSSAMRTGLLSAIRLPSMAMRQRRVRCVSAAPMSVGLLIRPTLIGAALTQRTRRCRIAMLGSLIALNNPVRIAEEYAMLDVMSGGRLIAGLMRGIPNEYIAYGVDPSLS